MNFLTTPRNLFTALFALSFFAACKKDKSVTQPAPAVMVSTYAGDGNRGFANGPALTASFDEPSSVAVDASGNVYVAEHKRIRKVSATGMVTTLAGDGTIGFADGNGSDAKFSNSMTITVDARGNVFVADISNHSIRKITADGTVTTLAGNGTRGFADGVGAAARFYWPSGIAVDANGNVYVADTDNSRIRKITPMGVVSTLAGNSTRGFVDGAGSAAKFDVPVGVAVDANGNVFVVDRNNHSIRKISPAGMVSTLAGNGTYGFSDGIGSAAKFYFPKGVAVDAYGNVFVADHDNSRIRKITTIGMVSTLAGNGKHLFEDGVGLTAKFSFPTGVAVDVKGNVFVADLGNNRIRKITTQ